jgi:3-oxoacyl-[acyl-carrier protein] reductase
VGWARRAPWRSPTKAAIWPSAAAIAVAVDVSRGEDIARFADTVSKAYGRVDILVNNSGGPRPGTFDQLDDGAFAQATDLLLLNVVRTTKAFLPLLRLSGEGGRIITITSTSAREPIANLMLSNALRAAVSGWSKTLSRELAAERILVNCVAPGSIDTERISELIAVNAANQATSQDAVRAALRTKIPLGRFGEPVEFAAAVAFLAGATASFITGTTLYVDGGASASVA